MDTEAVTELRQWLRNARLGLISAHADLDRAKQTLHQANVQLAAYRKLLSGGALQSGVPEADKDIG